MKTTSLLFLSFRNFAHYLVYSDDAMVSRILYFLGYHEEKYLRIRIEGARFDKLLLLLNHGARKFLPHSSPQFKVTSFKIGEKRIELKK